MWQDNEEVDWESFMHLMQCINTLDTEVADWFEFVSIKWCLFFGEENNIEKFIYIISLYWMKIQLKCFDNKLADQDFCYMTCAIVRGNCRFWSNPIIFVISVTWM